MAKIDIAPRLNKRRRMLGVHVALAALSVLVAVVPSYGDDQDSKEYGAVMVYQDPGYKTCNNEIWINGKSLSGREVHPVDSYTWEPGNPTPSSKCLSRDPRADSQYSISAVRDYSNTEQKSPYQNSCLCNASGFGCLALNAEAQNLSIYGTDFSTVIFAPGGCGSVVANGLQGGYFYHKNNGCFEVSSETVHVDAGSTINDVAVPIVVVSRDCRDDAADRRLWVYDTSNKQIRVGEDQSWCLVKSGTNQGDDIVVRKCAAVTNEFRQWNYKTGGDYSQIESKSQPGMCVDLIQNNMASGTKFQLYPCNQTDAQEWRLAW